MLQLNLNELKDTSNSYTIRLRNFPRVYQPVTGYTWTALEDLRDLITRNGDL